MANRKGEQVRPAGSAYQFLSLPYSDDLVQITTNQIEIKRKQEIRISGPSLGITIGSPWQGACGCVLCLLMLRSVFGQQRCPSAESDPSTGHFLVLARRVTFWCKLKL